MAGSQAVDTQKRTTFGLESRAFGKKTQTTEEKNWLILSLLQQIVVYTDRRESPRMISARFATRTERKLYEEA